MGPIGPLAFLDFGASFQVLDVEFEGVESAHDVWLIDVGGGVVTVAGVALFPGGGETADKRPETRRTAEEAPEALLEMAGDGIEGLARFTQGVLAGGDVFLQGVGKDVNRSPSAYPAVFSAAAPFHG